VLSLYKNITIGTGMRREVEDEIVKKSKQMNKKK